MTISEGRLMSLISNRIKELQVLLSDFDKSCADSILNISNLIVTTFKSGNKILICGNGGSAADAQHLAAEFVNSFSKGIKRPGLPAISLSTDTSVITAISNDNNFEQIFTRQVEALGKVGDALVVFTTSGLSKNCVNAINFAKKIGLKTILFTRSGAVITSISDLSIEVPSTNTQHIQECHILAYHIIVELVEKTLYEAKGAR
jgi:D-sedoheptulose 7-phosphate isomerase